MKPKYLLSALLISTMSIGFANSMMTYPAQVINKMISNPKAPSFEFCTTVLEHMSQYCIQKFHDNGFCSQQSQDRFLRFAINQEGGVENFCREFSDLSSCVGFLNYYISTCPTL